MPSDTASLEAESEIKIEEQTACGLYRLSRGWTPPSTPPRVVVELRWGGTKLDFFARRILLDEDGLRIECEIHDPDPASIDVLRGELNEHPIAGRCEDGTLFSARDAFITARGRDQSPEDHVRRVTISCRDWIIRRHRPRARLWAGAIDVELPPRGRGNLHFTSSRDLEHGEHYRFDGRDYAYYLIWSGQGHDKRWTLAVDLQKAPEPEHGLLRDEVKLIAASLGCPFHVSRLYGLDKRGNPVSVLGSNLGARPAMRPRVAAPVPNDRGEADWTPPFFSKASACLARQDAGAAGLRRAVAHFLRALDGPSEDDCAIHMLLGAILAARMVLEDEASPLAGREPRSAARLRGADLIRAALSRSGLEMTNEMREAVTAAARELDGEAGSGATEERNAFLRTILVALVSKAIGYGGPIREWEKETGRPMYRPADPSWWRAEDDSPGKRFVASIPDAAVPSVVSDLWPDFRLEQPTAPRDGSFTTIAAFAGALEAKTGGLVVASLEPVLRPEGEADEFDFVLRSTTRPTGQTVLFGVERIADGGVRITRWADTDPELRDDAETEAFLKDVAQSRETRREVERLMPPARPR